VAEAVALLDVVPAYPAAKMLSKGPYLSVPTGPEGAAPIPDAEGLRPFMGAPMTPYLIDLYREWRVPAGEGRVMAWVKAEAAARGLVEDGNGITGGTKPKDDTEGAAFIRARVLEAPTLQVDMRALDAGHTVVRYDAIVVRQPPRPPGEFLPAGAEAVTVQALDGAGGAAHLVASSVVRDGAQVAALVSLVNGLPRGPEGTNLGCPGQTGARFIVFLFRYLSGSTVSVGEGDCRGVVFGPAGAYPALVDPALKLWTTGAGIVGESGWLRGGTGPSTSGAA
jgi:hypothetical protein